MYSLREKIKIKIKKNEMTASTAQIAIWYVIGNIFAKGIAVITTPIFTRLLSKSEYGQFSNFVSWENIIIILVTLDFTPSITRAKYDFNETINEYISSILVFSNIVTICVYGFVEINRSFFEKLFSMNILYIRMLFIYLMFMPAFSYLQTKHRMYKKYIFFVMFSIGSAIIRTIVSVILVLLTEDKLLGRICGYLIPITLFNLVLWITILEKGRKVSWTYIKYACGISIPLIPHALSGIVLSSSDRIMITAFCGSEDTALYSVAYTVSMFATLLWTSMNQAWVPWLFDNMAMKNKDEITKNSKVYLEIYVILILGVLLVTPEIMLVLGGELYYSARYVMPPVIVGCVFQFIYSMYANIEVFSKKTFTISFGTMAAASLNLFLNWVFIPKYGYIAAAYTTMVGYFALMGFHYWIVKKVVNEYVDIYNRSYIILIIIMMLLAGLVSILLYDNNFVRYIFVLVYVVLLLARIYKKREQLKNILRH